VCFTDGPIASLVEELKGRDLMILDKRRFTSRREVIITGESHHVLRS